MKNMMENSPFISESYEQQQQDWLRWRAEILLYHVDDEQESTDIKEVLPPVIVPEPVRMPTEMVKGTANNRTTQLDNLYARHKAAGKNAFNWQSVTVTAKNP